MKTFELTHSLRVFGSACRSSAFIALGVMLLAPVASFGTGGDASRGHEVLGKRGCTVCHPVARDESGVAPNLGQVAARGLNPASFTALFWNHAPRMWEAMAERETMYWLCCSHSGRASQKRPRGSGGAWNEFLIRLAHVDCEAARIRHFGEDI